MFQDLTEMAEEDERRWLLAEDPVSLFDGCLHDTTSDEYRVILVGKTGSGKSSVGNRLLDRPDIVAPFPGSAAATPPTQEWADCSADPYGQEGFVGSDSYGQEGFVGSDPYGQGGFVGSDPYGQGGFVVSDPYGQEGFVVSDPYGQEGFVVPDPYGQEGFVVSDPYGHEGFVVSDPYGQGGFVVSAWPYTCTTECRCNEGRAWAKKLKVIDTPGIFATSEDVKHTLIELTRCMSLSAPGPHAIIFVIRLDSTFTPEEQDVFDKILKIFGERVREYMIIAFTHGEILDNHRSVEDVQRLVSMMSNLQTVLQSVQNRYVIFCNTPARQEEAVRELLQKIDQLKKQSSGPHFVNDTLRKQAEVIEGRARKLTQKRPDLSDAEVLSEVRRQIARSDDTKKYALKLLGGAPQDFSRLWI